jgi:hypothetical protein
MSGETNIKLLLQTMKPKLNPGEFVFCTVNSLKTIDLNDVLLLFKEQEGMTIIIKREIADHLDLDYSYIASWITLTVHSSLSAIGLTAAFSKALAKGGVSCNVVAAHFHDHIFVDKGDTEKAMHILHGLSTPQQKGSSGKE